jgi:hypothetical protein
MYIHTHDTHARTNTHVCASVGVQVVAAAVLAQGDGQTDLQFMRAFKASSCPCILVCCELSQASACTRVAAQANAYACNYTSAYTYIYIYIYIHT